MPYSNPIIAGETLVVPGIQSDGYVAGSTGWRVQRDGNAEFNDITLRGSWTIQGTDPNEFIEGRVTAGSPIIEIGRDGIFYRLQALSDGIFGERLAIGSQSGGTPGLALVDNLGLGSGRIAFGPGVTGNRAVVFLDEDLQSAINYDVDGWQAQSLMSGSGTVERRRMPDGTVMLRGSQVPAANTTGTDLFTLPAGWRPSTTVRFETASGAASAGGRVQITTAGLCEIAFPAATASYWYDGIRFSVL